ncbi:MAG: flagellin [Acidimicrobiia bacterium]|nr:flagellin [Acidimicrobiia bacterium]
MRINSNPAAVNAYRNLTSTNVGLGKSLEKLSSGFRINRAADDAAGLVKSETLRAEISGNKAAIRNAQDGISFVQTAEGAMNEVHSILQRMRELAVDAANTATTDGVAQQAEVDELAAELDAIGSRTKFAGKTVFSDYSTTTLDFQIGANSGDTLSVNDDLGLSSADTFGGNVSALVLTTGAGASAAIASIDTAIGNVSTARSTLGATQNRLEHVVNNLSVAVENLTASESRIRDTDMAMEMANFTKHQILSQAGTAMLAQANAVPQNVLTLLR